MQPGVVPAQQPEAWLTLASVLESVGTHHPLIEAGLANVEEAQAELRAARGEFDPVLSVQGRLAPAGYYDPRRLDVLIEQPTPALGAALYTGYRVTRGKVAPYYGEQRTLDAGEIRGGIRLPLLQGRSIDARRAGVQRARAQSRASEQGYERLMLEMERESTQAYYAWVAAGRRLSVFTELLALADSRDGQVKQMVELGALPFLEQLDNRRTILDRTRQLVAARRALEKASIDLSLFLRDRSGQPRVPGVQELPADLEVHNLTGVAAIAAEERALLKRPELAQGEALIEAAQVELAAAENAVQPRLDAFGEVSRDFGTGPSDLSPTLAPTVVEVGVTLSVPLLQRRARGKRDAADAKLTAAEQRNSFLRDKVRAEVRDALSQLRAAEERVQVAREGTEAARRVADGERERFELGATTVLFVNIREQAAADAQVHLIDGLLELGQSHARLTTAMGERLSRVSR